MISELSELFPKAAVLTKGSLSDTILQIHRVHPDGRFMFLIDEWDFLFREPSVDDLTRREYLDLLDSLFKSGPMDECLDLVYMTGIFPIPRYLKNTDAACALNGFTEYSMTRQRQMGKGKKYIGFREETVKELCKTWDMPFEDMKDWYDGYRIAGTESVYCPKSVVDSLTERTFLNYWANTSSCMTIRECLDPRIPGLKESLDCLLGGESVRIDPSAFLNTVDTLNTVDKVFGYLVHLGYLSFNQEDSTVSIPNREVRIEFREAVNTDEWAALRKIVTDARDLLQDIREGNSGAVAKALESAHDYKLSGPGPYDEASLTAVLRLAFFAAESYYTIIPEFPSGKGFAELSFIPGQSGILPMIVELKWNHTAETATTWVKQGLYRGRLKGRERILLVEISCHPDPGKYTCRIELWPPDETFPPAQAPVPSWVLCTKK